MLLGSITITPRAVRSHKDSYLPCQLSVVSIHRPLLPGALIFGCGAVLSGDGWKGILGELTQALSRLSDPLVREALPRPYDFNLEELCSEDQAHQDYLIVPPELIDPFASALKTIFSSAMTLKARGPRAPKQTGIIDEAARLKDFDQIVQLFTYGSGRSRCFRTTRCARSHQTPRTSLPPVQGCRFTSMCATSSPASGFPTCWTPRLCPKTIRRIRGRQSWMFINSPVRFLAAPTRLKRR